MNPGSIDVVILCGGLGTRLKPVVDDRPKPMADIGGRPFLAMILDHIAAAGFCRFVLCCCHKADFIISYFREAKAEYTTECSVEDEPLGTGGALVHALPMLRSDPVLVLNGDSFCDVDYLEVISAHVANSSAATVVVSRVANASDYGTVRVSGDGTVLEFAEKKSCKEPGWINGGVYVFSGSTLEGLSRSVPLSLERDVFPLLSGHGLFAFKTEEEVLDIGTPDRYQTMQKRLADLLASHSRKR